MVLTNFECWAHGGSGAAVVGNDGLPVDARHVDMFNPRMVQQRLSTAMGASPVSHISSNGYYGFSYVNAAHEAADGGRNNAAAAAHNTNNLNINNSNTNNNNNSICVPNANDVNGIPMMHNSMDVGVGAVGGAAATFDNTFSAPQRCKKRFFVSDDDYANCALLNDVGAVVAAAGLDVCAAKRCRFDDDNSAAQYCNDFFSLPSTQIGTQSCLMDTEDTHQQQQQHLLPQVDVNMSAVNITNQTSNTTSNIHFITQQQQQHAQQQQPQQQQVINAAQAPPVVVYQPQHNYQAKRRRQAIDYDASYDNSFSNIYQNNNINTANKNNNNNNEFLNKNQEIKHLASDAGMYNSLVCGKRESGIGRFENTSKIAEDNASTYQMNDTKFPAFTLDQKAAALGNTLEDNREDTFSIAALYDKIHGGAFYQFTAANAGSQPYVEDI